MSKKIETQLLVIGSGPAGYTAAIYAARANIKTVLVSGPQQGGQLTITTDVENFPGFAEPIQGPWLMEQMAAQATHVGAELLTDAIESVDFSARPFRCVGESGTTYLAQAVILATGAQARWLGIESERKFQGFGVSGCATCDGFFYRGKKVMVVGGGNSAMEEALYLAGLAEHVTIVHRRCEFRGEKVMRDRVAAHPKITIVWDSLVEEIKGDENPLGVTGVLLRNIKTDETTLVPVDGVFIAIGHTPATAVFKGQVETDAEGYIVSKPDSSLTSCEGVFAAGDVKDKVYRQAVTAAAGGCMAALDVERYLAKLEG